MAFEKYTSGSNSIVPKVTVSTRNQFYFNRGSIREMDLLNKKFVHLFYDKDTNRIGFQPIENKDNGTLSVHIVKDRENLATVNVKRFIDFYQIKHDKTRQYIVNKEGDMFVINLASGIEVSEEPTGEFVNQHQAEQMAA